LARWLSVCAGVVSVALLFRLGRHMAGDASHAGQAGGLAALLGAGSAFWLAESQEARMYTTGFALLGAAAVAWCALLPARAGWALPGTDGPLSLRRTLLFVVLTAAALLTHYNALFVVAAWYAAWAVMVMFVRPRVHALRAVVLCGLGTAALVAPIAPIALRQIPNYANPNLVVPTLPEYLRQNWQAYWAGYAYDVAWAGDTGGLWLWGAAVIISAALVTLLVKRSSPAVLFGAAWLAGATALYYLAVMDRGAFNVRYSSFVTPALYAMAGAGLVESARLRRSWLIAVPVAVMLWPVAVTNDLWDTRFDREDMSGVVAWLRRSAGPDDVIFVDQKYPFGFYYARYTVDAEVEPTGPEAAPARYLFVDINTLDRQLTRWAGDAQAVYWVQWFESDTDPRRAVTFLLDQAGERDETQFFRGYSVDRWELQPPNTFTLGANLVSRRVTFGEAVETVAVELPTGPVEPGGDVPVVVRWQRVPGGTVRGPLKARVALYDEAGARMAQRDERLLNDRHLLPSEWQPEDNPLNVYLLTVPPEIGEGSLDVGLLVYHAETLEPLEVRDEAGNPAGVEAMLGVVKVSLAVATP
jgi:mannosyltransferase